MNIEPYIGWIFFIEVVQVFTTVGIIAYLQYIVMQLNDKVCKRDKNDK